MTKNSNVPNTKFNGIALRPQSTLSTSHIKVIHKVKKCIKGPFFEQPDSGSVPD